MKLKLALTMVGILFTGLLLFACGGVTPIPTEVLATPTFSDMPEATPIPGPAITLKSVVISKTFDGNEQVTVEYGKTIKTCVHMITGKINGEFTEGWHIVHERNLFCDKATYTTTTLPIEEFDSTFKAGSEVTLCHGNNYNVCSQSVVVKYQR